MRQFMISCAICTIGALGAVAPAANAEEALYRCIDPRGTMVLTDRPCEATADTRRAVPEKEYFTLPPSEQGRNHWVRKMPVRVPPKIDVETLRLARQALELRDKVASAR